MSPVFRGLMAMEGGHMIPGQGALPVYRNGEREALGFRHDENC